MLRIERIFERGHRGRTVGLQPADPRRQQLEGHLHARVPRRRRARKRELARLVGVEDKVWVQVEGYDKVLRHRRRGPRALTEEKTSSVHFMRFELTPE
jgi:hypothetical protein